MALRITRRELGILAAAGGFSQATAQSAYGAMLWNYLREYLRILDKRRAAALASLESESDFSGLRDRVRGELSSMWGAFPERTSLTPSHIGTVDAGDHVIERLVFQSRPNLHVTANLYRPADASDQLAAVIFPCGHSAEGKAGATYQRFCALLARNGMAVLTWDPLGQGERQQFFEPGTGASRFRLGSGEHRVLGDRCYLLGLNLMQYRVWDAARALDYLASRPEFDPDRFGIAGQSGGGMVALQFACFDDRIQAAFASCAVASFRGKSEALLLADPEQVLYGTLKSGIDHPELLAAFAPKPLMIGAAIRDYVPIAAARRTHAELEAVYAKLGKPGNLHLAETDATHGLNRELREAGVRFFRQALGSALPAVSEPEASPLRPATELACTEAGQAAVSLGSASVIDMLTARADAVAPAFEMPATPSEFEGYQSRIAALITEVTRVGSFRSEHGIDIPTRLRDAGAYSKGAVFLVAEQGKDHPVVQRYVVDAILAASWSVYGMDVRGWGISAASMPSLDVSFEWDDFFAYRSLELGRPLFGQRLKDLLATGPRLTRRHQWSIAGVGAGGLLAANAAALDSRVSGVISIEALASYRSILDHPEATEPVSTILPGVLGSYDVAHVYASIAPRPLLVINPKDAKGRPLASDAAGREFKWATDIYEVLEAQDLIRIECRVGRAQIRDLIEEWLVSLTS